VVTGDYLNREVTVTDLSNYKSSYTKDETYPMKAILFEIDPPCYWVRSVKTNLEYELYDFQIAEIKECESD
jgi:hypothetical protein